MLIGALSETKSGCCLLSTLPQQNSSAAYHQAHRARFGNKTDYDVVNCVAGNSVGGILNREATKADTISEVKRIVTISQPPSEQGVVNKQRSSILVKIQDNADIQNLSQ